MKRLTLKQLVIFSLSAAIITGCASTPGTPTAHAPTARPSPLATPAPSILPTPAAYSDAFAYCNAVGTIDQPDAQYTGPKVPDNVIAALRKALNSPSDMPNALFVNGTFWRCMDQQVYACFVGANLPCDSKANVDQTPTQAEIDYCTQNPNSDFIPAVVTGHETIYNWKCSITTPEAGQPAIAVDQQGYQSNIWYPLSPQ